MKTLADYQSIAAAVRPHVNRTPLLRATQIGNLLGCDLWLKAELFQKTGSYKPRGMINGVRMLTDEQRQRGIITFSAGNAAAGLAYAGSRFGCKAVAVMPSNASPSKVAATRGYGGETILEGTSKDAFDRMQQLIRDEGYNYISPSDHPDIMAGNAAIGLEIHEDAPDADLVIAPIGAGGMCAGTTLGLRAAGSKARVVGVEPEGANSMWLSLQAGKPTDLSAPPNTIADGLAYPFGGQHTYPIVRDFVDKVLLVDDAHIREALLLVMTRAKLFAEPSGAAALAALMQHRDSFGARPGKVVLVVSGGNLDPDRLKTLL